MRKVVFYLDSKCSVPLTHNCGYICVQFKKEHWAAVWIGSIYPQIAKGVIVFGSSANGETDNGSYDGNDDFHKIPPNIKREPSFRLSCDIK